MRKLLLVLSLFVSLLAATVSLAATSFQYSGVLLDSSNNAVTGTYPFRVTVYESASCYLYSRDHSITADSAGHFSITISDSAGTAVGSMGNTLQDTMETGKTPTCYNAAGTTPGGTAGTANRNFKVEIYNGSSWEVVDDQPVLAYFESVAAQRLAGTSLGAGAANKVYGANSAGTANELKSVSAGSGVSITHSAGNIQVGIDMASFPAIDASKVTAGTFALAQIGNIDASQVNTGVLAVARIPGLDASQITAGSFATARIPFLDTSYISSGTFATARIPDLDTSKVVSGTFATARIPDLDTSKIVSGTFTLARIPDLDAAKITSGTFASARLGTLDAAKITTGTLAAAVGGTGLVPAAGHANKLYAVNAAGNGTEYKSLVQGSGVTIDTSVAGQITISSASSGGTVTNVGLTMPGIFGVAGGPVTGAGTFAVSLNNASQNAIFAGPATGGAGTPAFRALDVADIPSLNANKITSGTLNTAQIGVLDGSIVTTGTFATARLGQIPASLIDGTLAISQMGIVPAANGGTGLNGGAAADGRILIGNGAGYTLSTLGVSNGLSQTLSAGGIALTTNATNLNTASAIVSRDPSGNFSAGAIDVASTGIRGSTTGVVTLNAPASFTNYTMTLPADDGVNGQVLGTNGSGVTSWVNLPTGQWTNSAAGIYYNTGSVAIGRTNAAAPLDVNGVIRATDICDETGANCKDLSSGWGSGGTVTNVGLTGHSIFNITGSSISTSGTFNIDFANQSGNLIFASPDGGSGPPTFRSLSGADITSGTLATAIVGNLPASAITTGTFATARIGNLPASAITTGVLSHTVGGTGLAPSAGDANKVYAVNASGTGTEFKSIVQGSGVTVNTSTAGQITISATGSGGTVTNVGLAMPGIFNVTNSPVTTAGTMNVSLANAGQNMVFAGPPSGGAGTPSFRALVAADVSSGTLAMADGTALNPSYTFSSDSSTGLWRPGTGVLGFSTGGTERMRITSAGSVGIGTTAPGAKLDVRGTSGVVANVQGSASPFLQINTTSATNKNTNLVFASSGAAQFTLSADYDLSNSRTFGIYDDVASQMRMVLLANGNMGIGTTSPQALLDVSGTARMSSAQLVGSTTGSVTLMSPASVSTPYSIRLPASDGTSGQVLAHDGSGGLSWSTPLSGTVTNVGLTSGGIFSVTGGPVTGAGTFNLGFASHGQNLVLASPNGSAGVPTFRGLVAGDIPSLDGNKITSGTLALGRLGTIPVSLLDGTLGIAQLGVVPAANGGTGLNGGAAANGQLLIGNGTGFTLAGLGSSNGISITNGAGAVTVSTNAQTANTASTLVMRDGSGGFSAGAVDFASLGIRGSTTGVMTMNTPGSFTSYTLTWPATGGATGEVLTKGSGNNLTWSTPLVNGGTILATQGTFSTPGFAFNGDADTGIWSPGANTLAISTGGSERVRVAADGNVGIGSTVTSGAKLSVKSSGGGQVMLRLDGASAGLLQFYENSGNAVADLYDSSTALKARLNTSGPSYLNGGSLGVGTTTPGARLDVAGGIRLGDDTGTCTGRAGTLRYNGTALQICDGTSWTAVGGGGSGTPAGSGTEVQFNNGGSFGANGNFVWDNTNTRLGVGQSGPTETLDVNGNIKADGQIYNGITPHTYGSSPATLNVNEGNVLAVTVNGGGGAFTINLSNMKNGGSYLIVVRNQSGSGQTYSFGGGCTSPTYSPSNSAIADNGYGIYNVIYIQAFSKCFVTWGAY